MEWFDIACIVFACVTGNHLGLIGAIEKTVGFPLPIVNCCKCFAFWCVLAFCKTGGSRWLDALAISFLASYAAIWLELAEGYVDTLYMKLYGKIYPSTDDTSAADTGHGDPDGSVSELQQTCKDNN